MLVEIKRLLESGGAYTAQEIACAIGERQLDVEQYLYILTVYGKVGVDGGRYYVIRQPHAA